MLEKTPSFSCHNALYLWDLALQDLAALQSQDVYLISDISVVRAL